MIRLQTRALTLAVGNRTLCRNLSITFSAGENWAILGANGSGKTTLLRTLGGLRTPDEGSVLLDDVDLREWAARRRALQIGVLFQDYPLDFPLTTLELVLTGRHPHLGRWNFEGEGDRRIARTALAQMALESFDDRTLSTLSGGERRRAEIAAVLAQDAPICLWDEPTNHLDLRFHTEILRALASRVARGRHLNLFVMHDVNAARRWCSHALIFLPGGSTVAGPTSEILSCRTLEQAYGCEFRELSNGSERYYVAR
jgi:iron complex transport system ATP-binding protein